jgi:DNA adenine methylase
VKPPMPYFGGKQRIASEIVALFPGHDHYVEPYAGGLSVFLAKAPSPMETLNDLDGHLVTFWRVLRDRPTDLIAACELTPHSRAEMVLSRTVDDSLDEVEIARRVWVHLTQGRSGIATLTGWRFYLDGASTATSIAGYLDGYRRRMPAAAARLRSAQLECRDALDVVADYGRKPGTLLYIDPPYLPGLRRSAAYKVEADDVHHAALLEALRGCTAKVALSGYASELYDDALTGWSRTEIAASTQQANKVGANGRTEVIWTNYMPVIAETLDFGGAA